MQLEGGQGRGGTFSGTAQMMDRTWWRRHLFQGLLGFSGGVSTIRLMRQWDAVVGWISGACTEATGWGGGMFLARVKHADNPTMEGLGGGVGRNRCLMSRPVATTSADMSDTRASLGHVVSGT